ncbi:G-protein coupled receptor 157 isoform X1 [Neoarius graeffei]|uniref:G-protein coupled receptor 157 isoform X1 n=1 Tax=Neoarius graeffei TaxID=443677 RepID=UPI00298D3EB4|nr:G-protein coupled receptor 157 isoform X1 [Neoarius graeffei]
MALWQQADVAVSEQVVVLLSCAVSVLGSVLVVSSYLLWPDLRTTPRQLLVFLSVADFLSALSYSYGVYQVFKANTWDCVVQGAVSTFSNTSSFFWTVAIGVYLYIFIVKSSQRLADTLVLYFHLISWGVPLAITVAAVSLQKIGYDASEVSVGWCWISIEEDDHVMWMLLTGKIWELLAYVILPVLYILIKRHIHKAHAALSEYRPILACNRLSHSIPAMADRKLTLIPIIFIILRIWSTVRFVLLLTDSPARQNPVLVTLHGIGNTFQGAANCIMFVLCTRPIRARLAAQFCCRSHDTQSNSDMPSQYTAHTHSLSHTDRPGVSHTGEGESEGEKEEK